MSSWRAGAGAAMVAAVLWLACSAGDGGDRVLAIRNVTVIPMSGEPKLLDHVVLVSGGQIQDMGPEGSVRVPRGAEELSGDGGYLIPGLWDMHAHVFGPDVVNDVFPELLANGITGVRDMNGSVSLDSIARLKSLVADGRIDGPFLVAPGPLVDAPGRSADELSPAVLEIGDASEARAAVRQLTGDGADFIKVYNRMTLPLLEAVFAEAAREGIPVVGHVPASVAATALSSMGMVTQEHLQGLLEESSDAGDEFREFIASPAVSSPDPSTIARFVELRTRMVDEFDPLRATNVLEQLAQGGTSLTPTLVSNWGLLRPSTDTVMNSDPRFLSTSEELRAAWSQPGALYGLIPDDVRTRWRRRLLEIVGLAHAAGVGIIAGTDLGVPWVYAGSSLHDELVLLQEAGLKPLEALASATSKPAEVLGLDRYGSVEVGNVADLVILGSDPARQISAVRDVRYVIKDGRVLVHRGRG